MHENERLVKRQSCKMGDAVIVVVHGVGLLIELALFVAGRVQSQRKATDLDTMRPGIMERITKLEQRRVRRRPVMECNKSSCSLCSREYSWMSSLWQHHCRQCGRSMCDDCTKTKLIPDLGYTEFPGVKVCLLCESTPVLVDPEEKAADLEIIEELKHIAIEEKLDKIQ